MRIAIAAALIVASTAPLAVAQTKPAPKPPAVDPMGWNWEDTGRHMVTFLEEGYQVVGVIKEGPVSDWTKTFWLQKGPALIQCVQRSVGTATMHLCGKLAAPK